MRNDDPFGSFRMNRVFIRLTLMHHLRSPLTFRIVENLLYERGIDISLETVRFRWNRFDLNLSRKSAKKRTNV